MIPTWSKVFIQLQIRGWEYFIDIPGPLLFGLGRENVIGTAFPKQGSKKEKSVQFLYRLRNS